MADDNRELQEEEILALQAIYGEHCIQSDPNAPHGYNVTINLDDEEEATATLSPRILVVRFFLPETYPSQDPPVYEVTSVYCGTHRVDASMIETIDREFAQLFSPRQVVLFEWISWLRDYLEAHVEKSIAPPQPPPPPSSSTPSSSANGKNDDEELPPGTRHNNHEEDELINRMKSHNLQDVPVPPIYSSMEPLVDRRSVFVAHVAEVHSQAEVHAVISKLLENKKIAKATHNISAYRIVQPDGHMLQDNDDDGETAAGGRLLHLLQILDVKNVLVVVSRWFGGILLGADRFKDINNCARNALDDCGYIPHDNTNDHHHKSSSNSSKAKKKK
ncbi:hypothetical protein O0I10_002747 [Lichtheimia ornata]|uniref:RWD domain-containing protein n=1 Tax=Lichtheimia ornata TaxID=688661 RepID=A0AAD7VC45_9FUNG|nr:uncharacterized protein O0I10_002747 [Lichtheimia ornata]KAJ8661481.1 hypothetical protein O0I10_002747 [Lichtheimia ornata]